LLKVLQVSAGGFVGSILRYLIGGWIQSSVSGATFPYGTLAVNVTGCLVIGFISQLVETQGAFGPGTRAFLVVGVLGGYTTFSAFGNESVNLLRDGQRLAGGLNIGATLVLAIGAVWLGRLVAHLIWR
jgi:fluoride exporter